MKKKIIFFEPHLDSPRGHHMDSTIAKTISLQKYGKIFWFVNKKFKKSHTNIPNYISVINVLDTAKRKIFFLNFKRLLRPFFNHKKFFFIYIYYFSIIEKKKSSMDTYFFF